MFDIAPRSPCGCEITQFDIRKVAGEEIDLLRSTLGERGVAVIRGQQQVSDTDFVAFLKQLGPLTFTRGETPLAAQPALNVVSNIGRTRPPRSVFHTDTSYVTEPPAYTALRAVTLPQRGGETLFSDQYRAFATLPAAVKAKLATARVLHRISGLTPAADQETQSWQPLFRQHPLSGRIALYLSTPERCLEISGFSAAESQRMLRLLYKHSIRPQRIYRHRWQAGDIVVWDNRCTMHRADHSQVIGDRVLHRGMVAGEVPLGI